MMTKKQQQEANGCENMPTITNETRKSQKSMLCKRTKNLFSVAVCLVIIVQISLHIVQTSAYQNHPAASSGMSPSSSSSVPYQLAADQSRSSPQAIKWHYNQDHHDGDEQLAPSQAHRRTSEGSDLEDGLEEEDDEDRDEYARAGSTNHDRYALEEPSYGESQRAARDGDDIEGFFDKHLGPQEAEERANEADEVPIQELSGVVSSSSSKPARRAHRRTGGNVDQFEAAASSPLSTIFQSLLSHHKRPFIIHTTTDDDTPSSSSSSSSSSDSNQSTSSSAPVGSSVRGNAAAGAVPAATAYVGATPIAYFTPIAAPSNAYDQAGPAPMDGGGPASAGSSQQQDEYGPVREIYISRRPTLINHPAYQTGYTGGQGQRLEHQSSNAYWRGASPMMHRPTGYQAADDGQTEYARYPVAASYAYGREQQAMAAPPAEEEQTVSFSLGFGGRPSEAADEESSGGGSTGAGDEQTSVDEAPYEPAAYNTRQLMRHSSSMRSYNNNYNYQPPNAYQARHFQPMTGQQQQQQHQHQYHQQQAPYGGARYHKDPSESTIQPVSYGQYR